VKPLSERYSTIIGIVNVGRGDEDRDVWHEVAALEARIEALENVVAAKQNIIKSIQATVNDHLEAEAALRSEEER